MRTNWRRTPLPASSATPVTSSTSAAPASANRDRSIKSLIQEIQFATQLELPFLVLHPGAHLGAGEAAGIKQIVADWIEVFAATKRIARAHRAGKHGGAGDLPGNKIEHLAAVFDRVKKPERLGVCLDTAHFFAAGYDIRTPKGWNAAIREVASLIGLKQILAFHLNDSKTDLGSRVDRHEHIGKGKIGKEAFRHIVNDARFKKHPGCLETPKSEDLHEDVQNLAYAPLAGGYGAGKVQEIVAADVSRRLEFGHLPRNSVV